VSVKNPSANVDDGGGNNITALLNCQCRFNFAEPLGLPMEAVEDGCDCGVVHMLSRAVTIKAPRETRALRVRVVARELKLQTRSCRVLLLTCIVNHDRSLRPSRLGAASDMAILGRETKQDARDTRCG